MLGVVLVRLQAEGLVKPFIGAGEAIHRGW